MKKIALLLIIFLIIPIYVSAARLKVHFNSDFMVDLFMFSTTQNIKSTIEYGMPVIVIFGNCYITVVGIQYDGDIIYANHDNGNLYAVEKDYFNNYENIVIEGVPQELPNPYLLNQ